MGGEGGLPGTLPFGAQKSSPEYLMKSEGFLLGWSLREACFPRSSNRKCWLSLYLWRQGVDFPEVRLVIHSGGVPDAGGYALRLRAAAARCSSQGALLLFFFCLSHTHRDSGTTMLTTCMLRGVAKGGELIPICRDFSWKFHESQICRVCKSHCQNLVVILRLPTLA